jgi:hypothetical protein
MIRYSAVGALIVISALGGCTHLHPGSHAPAPTQPAQRQGSAGTQETKPESTTTPSSEPPSEPAVSSPSQSKPTRADQGREAASPKDLQSQPQNTSPRKPKAGSPAAAGKSTTSQTETRPSAPPSPASVPASERASPSGATPAAPLNLTSLEQRLKDTKAIGVFTKLSLKNQVDDLLSQLRAFHSRKSSVPLSELRQRYDLLLLKVLSLLQNGDPSLASAISSSREAIWGILSDPQKFAQL